MPHELVHIFIALAMPAAGGIVVGEPVDQADLRPAGDDRRHVHDRDASEEHRRDPLECRDDRLDLGRHVALHGCDHDLLTALAPPPAFVE
jgi:hypothetical protein